MGNIIYNCCKDRNRSKSFSSNDDNDLNEPLLNRESGDLENNIEKSC